MRRAFALMVLVLAAIFVSSSALGVTIDFADSASEKDLKTPGFFSSEPKIIYLTFNGKRESVEEISVSRWKRFRSGGRLDYLSKFYFANTREKSNRGYRHSACFEGSPAAVAESFLGASVDIRDVHPERFVSISSDGHLMGIQFTYKDKAEAQMKIREAHFRLPHCTSAGKADVVRIGLIRKFEVPRTPQSDKSTVRFPAQTTDDDSGFVILDEVDESEIPTGVELPRFTLKSDFAKAPAGVKGRPWRGMDATTEAGGFQLAEFLQAYFYDGMANQSTDPDQNFIAENSKKVSWCHMPWLNVGPSGREGVHGMTMERDLYPSNIYPDTPPASDWGVAYYNSIGCETIRKVFGAPDDEILNPPKWGESVFKDGAMAVKILFTTGDFPAVKGAFQWFANVSLPKSTSRSIRKVNHIQMDIALRDSSIKGAKADLNHWLMTTYYFDRNYQLSKDSPLAKIKNLPEGFKYMRPQGVQTGFDLKDTILFAGAKTNQNDGHMNGPADNPKSNCMACHGAAGTRMAMAPGVKDNQSYIDRVKSDPGQLDFSQQIALAKKNFETKFKAGRSGVVPQGQVQPKGWTN